VDLALYSPSYTATRILALPECVDLGGEEPGNYGFCPVELFVPTYAEIESVRDGGPPSRSRRNNPKPEALAPKHSAEGILKREERFGYVELPDNVKLSEAIDMTDYLYDPEDEDAHSIAIALRCRFDLRDGKPRNRFGSP
jgi:hypothetical protein